VARRKFVGTSKAPKGVYIRFIYDSGYSKLLAVTKVVPRNWKLVAIEKAAQDEDWVMLKITKLLTEEEYASAH